MAQDAVIFAKTGNMQAGGASENPSMLRSRSNNRRFSHPGSGATIQQLSSDHRGAYETANLARTISESSIQESPTSFQGVSSHFDNPLTTSIDALPDFPPQIGALPGLEVQSLDDITTEHQSLDGFLQLDSLDYLTNLPNHIDLFSSLGFDSDPLFGRDMFKLDPMFNNDKDNKDPSLVLPNETTLSPNTMNQHLQTTLFYHMVETARNTALTRNGSPDPEAIGTDVSKAITSPAQLIDNTQASCRESGPRFQTLKVVRGISKQRQVELWRNYLDEVAVWLDMFDNDRNFQFQIPLMAKSSEHLQYAILALSARQLERKSGSTYTESIILYQEAIALIVTEMYTLDTSVVASCVLLCVLEMMSSSSGAWCRHLDGCAMLLEAAGINGVVGGVRQSLFWCFSRMDVWGGFLEDTITKIPTSRWFIPSGSMIEAVTHFKAGSGSHSYANYSVFLCASVVNVISNKNSSSHRGSGDVDTVRSSTYATRWKALFDLLDDWYNNRPEEMQPLIAFAPNESEFGGEPFPTLMYASSPAINGNQLYHAATLLMLQNKPRDFKPRKSSKSILWHARQICGIAVSNSDHGALINGLHPIWIAGRLMSHSSEHKAILGVLSHIEKRIGWATAWRAEDLKEYWGCAEDSEMY